MAAPVAMKYLVFHGATHYMCIRTDEAVVSDAQGMARRAPENSVLHHDALSTNGG